MENTIVVKKNSLTFGEMAKTEGQYSLGQILGIWALVALPMAVLAWVVTPALIPALPFPPGISYWLLIILGMTWEFGVSLVIIYRELGTLNWRAIRQRTWLNLPHDPATQRPAARYFWWLLPCILFDGIINLGLEKFINAPLTWLFPGLKAPAYADFSQLANPRFAGQWWLLGIFLVSALLNYFLAEEFLFRGILLPKMKGVFGRWDWAANALLFGLYHLHKPWYIPSAIVSGLAMTWPARRFQSNWMSVIVHGVEGVFMLTVVLSVILGLTH